MSHRNKERSYEHEVEINETAAEHGLESERAYASDGSSLVGSDGSQLTDDVDNVVYRALPDGSDLLVQCKRRKSLGSYLVPPQRGVVYLQSPELLVLEDEVFFRALSGEEVGFLTRPTRVESRSRVAGYVCPPEGSHVTALRKDHDTTSYFVVPKGLFQKIRQDARRPKRAGKNDDRVLREAKDRIGEVIDDLIAQNGQ